MSVAGFDSVDALAFLGAIPCAAITVDATGIICAANAKAGLVAGAGQPIDALPAVHLFPAWPVLMAQADRARQVETELVRPDGVHVPVELSFTTWNRSGERMVGALFWSIVDRRVSDAMQEEAQQQAQQALQEARIAEQRLQNIIEMLPQALCVFDADDRYVLWNRRYAELYPEIAAHLAKGVLLEDILRLSIASGQMPEIIDDPEVWLSERLRKHRLPVRDEEQELRDGRWLRYEDRRTADGGSIGLRVDITDLKRREARISHLALHDPLTGLANRIQFRGALETVLARRTAEGGEVVVHCLDLDGFKPVNDTYGHAAGDELLRQVAERMKRVAGEGDLVARLGGDEFAVLQRSVATTAPELAQRLVAAVGRPYDVFGGRVVIGSSAGIAISPHDGLDADQLMKAADVALYEAKASGKNTWRQGRRQERPRVAASHYAG